MQNIGIHTIEDCLEILTGIQKHNLKFTIKSSDSVIINSIARQVFKGVALTDRQYELMKNKLLDYRDQFENNNVIGFDCALKKLRKDLRYIDRSKYIKVVQAIDGDENLRILDKKEKYIKIKFPFSKSLILKIQNCVNKIKSNKYIHQKGSHEHYFIFDEFITKTIVEEFQNCAFEIDKEILDFYSEIKEIADNIHLNLPVIMDDKLFVNDDLKKRIEKDINLDFRKIVDRHRRYGLINLQTPADTGCLVDKIAYRPEIDYYCDPNVVDIKEVLNSICELNRFPLLVVVQDGKEEEQLYPIYNTLKDVLSSKEQSILFRLDGDSEFNKFVKDENLNNWVDSSIKIVYIQSSKLPKVLFKTNWKPITALIFDISSRFYRRHVQYYINNTCDLVIVRSDNDYQKKIYNQYNDYM